MSKPKKSKMPVAAATTCSPVGRVEWQGANLHSNIEGVTVPAWILSVNGRPILHAVALSEIGEPVRAEDRKMIGQALAEYLSNSHAHPPDMSDDCFG